MDENIECIYVSGASMIFKKKDDNINSQFTVMVLPLQDQKERKEIIALTDSNIIKEGLFKRPINNVRDVIKTFSNWCNSDAESINKMSDFFKENLDIKKIIKKKTSVGGKFSPEGVEGNYMGEKEF